MAKRAKAAEERSNEVDAFMAKLQHPLKKEIEVVRAAILHADPRINESVKWNAPSFYLDDHFCTFKLRPVESVQLILHRGAKVRADAGPMQMDDPGGLLKWLAADRCMITFADMLEIEAKQGALIAVLKAWIEQL